MEFGIKTNATILPSPFQSSLYCSLSSVETHASLRILQWGDESVAYFNLVFFCLFKSMDVASCDEALYKALGSTRVKKLAKAINRVSFGCNLLYTLTCQCFR